jgi:predicted outer membrane repeat protein
VPLAADTEAIVSTGSATLIAHISFCDPSATGSDNGTSWEDAYDDLQDAIDNASTDGAVEIWMKSRNVTLTAQIDFDSTVDIYGGFANSLTGTSGSVAGRDLDSNTTTLDGDDTYRCMEITVNSRLDGFTITQGSATGAAGINITGADPTIANCTISQCNSTTGNGGGVSCVSSSDPTFTNCTFTYNVSDDGGGLFIDACTATVTDCDFDHCHADDAAGGGGGAIRLNASGSGITMSGGTVEDNTSDADGAGISISNMSVASSLYNVVFDTNAASDDGGALYIFWTSATLDIDRCTFDNNSTTDFGGHIFIYNSDVDLVNSVFVSGSADYGGAVYHNVDATPDYTNCTFADNVATTTGGAIRNTGSSVCNVTNCILWDDTASGSPDEIANAATITVTYSDVEGGYTGTGNVNDDPLFLGSGNDPYDLDGDSDAVDSANESAPDYPSTDKLGRSRVSTADMGAYEWQGS